MSMFNSKKESSPPAPPAPPSGAQESGLDDIKKEISSPPPSPSQELPPSPVAPQSPVSQASQSMPQASSSGPSPGMSPSTPMNSPQQPQVAKVETHPSPSVEKIHDDPIEEESLFNLDDFELPSLDGVSYDKAQSIGEEKVQLASPHSQRESNHLFADDFVPTKGLSVAKDDTYFLTTTEFKHLLEQIDAVKERIKASTQRHMKILSIKAEEDIEIESMKKDFQFIEDKLYEVDSTIFDR